MRATQFRRFGDRELLRMLAEMLAKDRSITTTLLALIAEVDSRRLYLGEGFPSIYRYCVEGLHLSEDAAYKRIQAARAARKFPALFRELSMGRLHLSAVVLLAPHLTTANADELIGASLHKSKAEIQVLLARRFPRTEPLPMVHALPSSAFQASREVAPGQVGGDRPAGPAPLWQVETGTPVRDGVLGLRAAGEVAPGQLEGSMQAGDQLSWQQVAVPSPRSKVTPLSGESFALHLAIGKNTHDKLRHAQALLSHAIPSGDLADVLDRVLDLAIQQLEKRKFSATDRPRPAPPRPSSRKRHVPARVKRAVWERDQGQCTFESEHGRRCGERKFLEYDHVDPVACGGEATVRGIRLRCRAHNQHEAERAFGSGFMAERREEARRRRAWESAATGDPGRGRAP